MILIKADGTVVPLGVEGLRYGKPVAPDFAQRIRMAVNEKIEEYDRTHQFASGNDRQIPGHWVVGAEPQTAR